MGGCLTSIQTPLIKSVWGSCLVKGAGAVPVYADCKESWGHPLAADFPRVREDAPPGQV
jgi:hypothetical protein